MTYFRRMLRLGLLGNSQGADYSAEAESLFAAMSAPPSDAWKAVADTLITTLVSAGIWAKFDKFHVMAAPDAQSSKLDWKNPGTKDLSPQNGMLFSPYVGYTAASTKYLDTTWDPATNGVQWTQNSAHFGVVVTEAGNSNYQVGRTSSGVPNLLAVIDSGLIVGRVNSSAGSAFVANSTTTSGFVVNRSGAAALQVYVNGASVATGTAASQPLDSEDIFVGQAATGLASTDRFSAYHCGTSLSAGEVSTLHTALLAYMRAVGAFAPSGVWTWFNGPEAVRYSGTYNRTYFGYANHRGDTRIAYVDHDNGDAYSLPFTLKSALQIDDHINPAILVRPDGKLLTVYTKHNGPMYSRISTNAEDITAWGAESTVDAATTLSYANLEMLSAESNTIHLFHRDGVPGPWKRKKSTDSGETWSSSVSIIDNSGQRPYMRCRGDGASVIHFVFGDGNPEEVSTNSLYHCYYDGTNWKKSDGTTIRSDATLAAGSPILTADATKLWNSTGESTKAWIYAVGINSASRPFCVFAVFPTAASDHRYYYGEWTGSAWVTTEVCTAGGPLYASSPYYSGGIRIYDEDTLYCVRQVSSMWGVYKCTRSAGVWTLTLIEEHAAAKYMRPVVPRGTPHSSAKALVPIGTYDTYASYNMAIKKIAT